MLTDDKKVPEVFTFILEKESLHSKGHYYILKPVVVTFGFRFSSL